VNHLAHALIALRTGTSVVGNLMGDFVKGRPESTYEGELLRGIRTHRVVDAFVDAHPAFWRSRGRLPSALRRWSGILVDVGYDHALARRWDVLGEGTLREFADSVYAQLDASRAELPERMRGFVDYMTSTDLLAAYRDPEGVTRALAGMSHRVGRANPLGTAAPEVLRIAMGLEEDLSLLLPETVRAARRGAEEDAR
jgi:acyl carrier protein phosphodiesterase